MGTSGGNQHKIWYGDGSWWIKPYYLGIFIRNICSRVKWKTWHHVYFRNDSLFFFLHHWKTMGMEDGFLFSPSDLTGWPQRIWGLLGLREQSQKWCSFRACLQFALTIPDIFTLRNFTLGFGSPNLFQMSFLQHTWGVNHQEHGFVSVCAFWAICASAFTNGCWTNATGQGGVSMEPIPYPFSGDVWSGSICMSDNLRWNISIQWLQWLFCWKFGNSSFCTENMNSSTNADTAFLLTWGCSMDTRHPPLPLVGQHRTADVEPAAVPAKVGGIVPRHQKSEKVQQLGGIQDAVVHTCAYIHRWYMCGYIHIYVRITPGEHSEYFRTPGVWFLEVSS